MSPLPEAAGRAVTPPSAPARDATLPKRGSQPKRRASNRGFLPLSLAEYVRLLIYLHVVRDEDDEVGNLFDFAK